MLRRSSRRPRELLEALAEQSPRSLLEVECGLLADEALEAAAAELDGWRARGITVITMIDDGYPSALRAAPGAPPLLFAVGPLDPDDPEAVAVVGSRNASSWGRRAARAVARRLTVEGRTVVSGLAAGIDSEVHQAALDHGGRTIAVVGCGLDHFYPRQNAELQREIARRGAVISQFWPESRPSRQSFPMRNVLMAGMACATVIVEASPTSGTRIQARAALAAGRRVLLTEQLLAQQWARELSARPGVHVVNSPADVISALDSVGAGLQLTLGA